MLCKKKALKNLKKSRPRRFSQNCRHFYRKINEVYFPTALYSELLAIHSIKNFLTKNNTVNFTYIQTHK